RLFDPPLCRGRLSYAHCSKEKQEFPHGTRLPIRGGTTRDRPTFPKIAKSLPRPSSQQAEPGTAADRMQSRSPAGRESASPLAPPAASSSGRLSRLARSGNPRSTNHEPDRSSGMTAPVFHLIIPGLPKSANVFIQRTMQLTLGCTFVRFVSSEPSRNILPDKF